MYIYRPSTHLLDRLVGPVLVDVHARPGLGFWVLFGFGGELGGGSGLVWLHQDQDQRWGEWSEVGLLKGC